jgi:hypothetical protein
VSIDPNFVEFVGGIDRYNAMRPILKLQLYRQWGTGTPVSSDTRQRQILALRYGADESKWPVQERARLLPAMSGPPKPVAPTSTSDLVKQAAGEVLRLEAQLADHERIHPGDTMNMRTWRDNQAAAIRSRLDKIAGTRRRTPESAQ